VNTVLQFMDRTWDNDLTRIECSRVFTIKIVRKIYGPIQKKLENKNK